MVWLVLSLGVGAMIFLYRKCVLIAIVMLLLAIVLGALCKF